MNEIVITRCLYIDHYLIKIILTRSCPPQKTWLGGNSEFARYMMAVVVKVFQVSTNTEQHSERYEAELVEVVLEVLEVFEVVLEVLEVVVV